MPVVMMGYANEHATNLLFIPEYAPSSGSAMSLALDSTCFGNFSTLYRFTKSTILMHLPTIKSPRPSAYQAWAQWVGSEGWRHRRKDCWRAACELFKYSLQSAEPFSMALFARATVSYSVPIPLATFFRASSSRSNASA